MAVIKPFCGVRYFGRDISKLVCPPYDIISEKEKNELKKTSRFNLVRIELPDQTRGKDKYKNAKFLFNDWLQKDILEQDTKESFYLYEQYFKDKTKFKSRKGFFAALKLENPHKGVVKPHEKTLAKPKEDRLNLIRAVQANISPIFGLFNDDNKSLIKLCDKTASQKATSYAKDSSGVTHKLWKIDDEAGLNLLKKVLKGQDIFIADGHHRYETAWNYLNERKKSASYKKAAGYNYVLTYLCSMEDPGLVVWPTHRVFTAPKDIEENIAKYFNILPKNKFMKLSLKTPQPILIYYKGKSRALAVKNERILKKAMPDKCKAYQELGVSILHNVLLKDLQAEDLTYLKSEKEAYKLADKKGNMAAIVPATPVKSVKEIALAGQTMPQKSTYFYPKVITGMVINRF
ncbi:MAG: DUF1015 domain-containing protein [Elusimicrobia bacterium]|nr:DUF1015 domain-containing protein [Candidatus Liberimonas magnetica]